MQELDFSLDGVWASTKGIYLQKPVSFSPAVRRADKVTLPGRSGDLHIDTGAVNNRTATAVCFALNLDGVISDMDEAMAFLLSDTGYKKLMTTEDSEYYWYVTVSNAGEIAPRLNKLNPYTIQFDCKPYKIKDGSETLVANQTFVNPTGFRSYPLIHVVSGSTGAVIESLVGRIELKSNVTDVYIDCEDCVCYYGNGTNANSAISGKQFIEFVGGNNTITVTGTVQIEVAPRWCCL